MKKYIVVNTLLFYPTEQTDPLSLGWEKVAKFVFLPYAKIKRTCLNKNKIPLKFKNKATCLASKRLLFLLFYKGKQLSYIKDATPRELK